VLCAVSAFPATGVTDAQADGQFSTQSPWRAERFRVAISVPLTEHWLENVLPSYDGEAAQSAAPSHPRAAASAVTSSRAEATHDYVAPCVPLLPTGGLEAAAPRAVSEGTESRPTMSLHERLRQPSQQALETALWLTSWLIMALFMLYGLGHSMIRQTLALCRLPSSEAPQPERRLHRRRKRGRGGHLHPHRQSRRHRERRTAWRSVQGRERGLAGWRELARHDLPRPETGRFSA
jgi:hypothetical protein